MLILWPRDVSRCNQSFSPLEINAPHEKNAGECPTLIHPSESSEEPVRLIGRGQILLGHASKGNLAMKSRASRRFGCDELIPTMDSAEMRQSCIRMKIARNDATADICCVTAKLLTT